MTTLHSAAATGLVPPPWCEHHGGAAHEMGAPSAATAPANARAWLLIEFNGPWAAESVNTAMPAPLADLAAHADQLGIRVQLIRRPRRPAGPDPDGQDFDGPDSDDPDRDGVARDSGDRDGGATPAVFAAWTTGTEPWLRRMSADDLDQAALAALATGQPAGGTALGGPLFLVCTHARRDRCCAHFGVPLARELSGRHPAEVWETTHLGGHRFAANLAILPHGLCYGPVDPTAARDAIDAYQRGEVTARGFRGRAGQPTEVQEAECAAVTRSGTLTLSTLTA